MLHPSILTDVSVLSPHPPTNTHPHTETGGDTDSRTVELIVTNSLTPDLRFAAETVRYQLTVGAR